MSLYSSKPIEISIPEGCPWHEAQVTYGTPNVDWCEPTVCGYINEPANTWSNLPFLIIGILLWKKMKTPLAKNFGLIVVIMGTLSGIYHASNNLLTQYFDFIGMALMASYFLAFALKRTVHRPAQPFDRTFWMLMTLNISSLLFIGVLKLPLQIFMMFNAIGVLVAETYCFFVAKSSRKVIYLLTSFVILIFAQWCAQIDLKRIWCHPENTILFGHVFWHVLCAIAMYFAGRYIEENSNS